MKVVRVCDLVSGDNRYAKTHEQQLQSKHFKKLAQEKNKGALDLFKGQKGLHQFSPGFKLSQNNLVEPFQNKQKYSCKRPTQTAGNEGH